MATSNGDEEASVIGEAGQRELHSVPLSVGARFEPRLATEHGNEPLTDVFEADTATRRGRRLGVAWVLDRNRQSLVTSRDVEANHSALEQSGNAVRDGVLDERLQ